jgi:hypothetical protein
MSYFETPVVFIIFNRPDLTEKVFAKIREVKPNKLFVIADGARFPKEQEKCDHARKVIEQVDWNCEVITDFSDINLGCKKRVSSGLDWVFSQVEEAIVLEDDCLPTESFFYFCQELLSKYRYDERIMMISGNNYPNNHLKNNVSYFFSKYTLIWGWATWKRAWQYYDVELKNWNSEVLEKVVDARCINLLEKDFRKLRFKQTFDGTINAWSPQWLYTCWSQNGLAILPKHNLVSNIGFRKDGTHTQENNRLANLPTQDIWQIKHPQFIYEDVKADAYLFDYWFDGINLKQNKKLLNRLINKIKVKLKTIKKLINKA